MSLGWVCWLRKYKATCEPCVRTAECSPSWHERERKRVDGASMAGLVISSGGAQSYYALTFLHCTQWRTLLRWVAVPLHLVCGTAVHTGAHTPALSRRRAPHSVKNSLKLQPRRSANNTVICILMDVELDEGGMIEQGGGDRGSLGDTGD